ncbi:MAG: hypothetical protein WBC44_16875 [Planctomycetaceae bacterium]
MKTASLWTRLPRLFLPIVFAMAATGCTQTSRDLALDDSKARGACATALEAWKAGKKPADLKPDVIASDYGWASGQKLLAFEFLPGETSDGTNLHIPVKLTLEDGRGVKSTANAIYTVGTSPVVTVIRD